MLRPFQCLLGCLVEKTRILLAASGSCIYSFDLSHGSLLSQWSAPEQTQAAHSETRKTTQLVEDLLAGKNEPKILESQLKPRQNSPEVSEIISSEVLIGENGGSSQSPKMRFSCPAVIRLAGPTKDQHVVVVTEDKCIRVLHLSNNGVLTQLSQRPMPKKPCAVIFTPDEKAILCADKFGDVYSLPLISSSSQRANASINGNHDKPSLGEGKSFPKEPAANFRTVHTRRNQDALRNQQRTTTPVAKRRTLDFSRKLLLGHVSLLTDLVYVTLVEKTLLSKRQRNYILTSDRDEHIRVSRGVPQTHLIERYCLGHTEFVSKLCIPCWNTKVLISGGGDDFLLIWDWLSGTARQKVDLKNPVCDFKKKVATWKDKADEHEQSSTINKISVYEGDDHSRIAVSGIWALRRSARESEGIEGDIVVICEGIPALFIFGLDMEAIVHYRGCCPVPGNVVDATALNETSTIIYSLDNYHTAFSTTALAHHADQLSRPMLGHLSFNVSGDWEGIGDLENTITCMDQCAKASEPLTNSWPGNESSLREMLYGIENFRKRGHEDSE